VIEDVNERALVLKQAWDLACGLLIVAALVKEDGQRQSQSPFGDGVLTGRGTFQKFFGQAELKAFLEAELQAEAIPASLGIFYIFRDETLQQQFLASGGLSGFPRGTEGGKEGEGFGERETGDAGSLAP
jgi:DNA phosphorothioation-associated putative methyltransferase